jgi:hypothetical protein|tara:strand:- start:415 stop:567 length:153 start_codon:yes stop_codon:yes gene_type:complete
LEKVDAVAGGSIVAVSMVLKTAENGANDDWKILNGITICVDVDDNNGDKT